MSDGTALTLLYDGTFEGLMTAVFEAYTRRPMPASIAEEAGYQTLFGERAFYIAADMTKADRVTAGIRRSMGWEAYEKIWLAFLSEQPERGRWIYDYIRLGFEQGRRIASLLTRRPRADHRQMEPSGVPRKLPPHPVRPFFPPGGRPLLQPHPARLRRDRPPPCLILRNGSTSSPLSSTT